jgi:hypothetical protein
MNNPEPWWLTWPVAEVAAAILPLFSHPPFSPSIAEQQAVVNIDGWFRTGSPHGSTWGGRGTKWFEDPDTRAIAEAIQVLEHANLLMRAVFSGSVNGVEVGLTRLGWQTLQTNTVRQHLGLSDTSAPG